SLVLFWTPPTSAGFIAGACTYPFTTYSDANVCAYRIPRHAQRVTWYKGNIQNANNRLLTYTLATRQTTPGPANDGRYTTTRDGSLRILRVSKVDTAFYILVVEMPNNQTLKASLYYFAQEPVSQHSIQVSRSSVPVNSTVFIACLTKNPGFSTHWFFNDRRLHLNERMRLSQDQRTFVISPVKMEDAGEYHCKFVKRLVSGKKAVKAPLVLYEDTAGQEAMSRLLRQTTEQTADAMEAPSTHGYRGRVPSMGILLAVSLLLLWIPHTSGGFIAVDCGYPLSRHSIANICVQRIPRDAQRLFWYKGDIRNANNRLLSYVLATRQMTPGLANNGRQRVNRDGSLRIINVSKVDTAYYTLVIEMPDNQTLTSSVYYFFQEPVSQHSVQVSRSSVPVNSTVFIAGLTGDPGFSTYWFFNDRRLHLNERMTLSQDHMTLVISPVKMEDAGQYHCKFVKRLISRKSERLRLEVVNRNP
ncbi:Carcinoembryonic antigen-related cell adhesion molecule 21, partial [Galemys pyrenaicus]